MRIIDTRIPGLILIEPEVFEDIRGDFFELWNEKKYQEVGVPTYFAQDNISFSKKGILRGLHFQTDKPQGKLVSTIQGEVFDVVVDLRKDSPTYGKWESFVLNSQNKLQLYIPEEFAHGFYVLSENAIFLYKCTNYYNTTSEHTLIWNDPDVDIEWPETDVILSEKDTNGISFQSLRDVIKTN